MAEPEIGRPGAQLPPAGSLGKYRLIAALGQGGMAKVMLALVSGPARINKLTVLKILRDDLSADRDALQQLFVAEARLSARFCDPNLVQTFEAELIDGRYVLAMEYLEGKSYQALQTRAAKLTGLPLHEHLRILSCVARGLHYAHTLADFDGQPLGVVHRDVSPHNVFITYDGQVKLLDFGIAQTRDSHNSQQARLLKGRLDYMAPEQLTSELVDPRADVFALGVMLWEALSGSRFAGGREVSDAAKAQARLNSTEPDIRQLCPDAPRALTELVTYALVRDPVWRLSDAASFANALDSYLEEVGAKTSARSLAGQIAPMFERERSRFRALVEQQLQTESVTAADTAHGLPAWRERLDSRRKVAVAAMLALSMLAGAALAWYGPRDEGALASDPGATRAATDAARVHAQREAIARRARAALVVSEPTRPVHVDPPGRQAVAAPLAEPSSAAPAEQPEAEAATEAGSAPRAGPAPVAATRSARTRTDDRPAVRVPARATPRNNLVRPRVRLSQSEIAERNLERMEAAQAQTRPSPARSSLRAEQRAESPWPQWVCHGASGAPAERSRRLSIGQPGRRVQLLLQ